ncbi:MAG: OmpA family protein [Desulfatitalea sp.]|nr:OmpA family protein [Desulfatitalea sp.]NNK02703.1 OmpA family protein [Desulfatitalea sp.]
MQCTIQAACRVGVFLLATGWITAVAAGVNATNFQNEPLVIHFDTGKAVLGATDTSEIRRRLDERGFSPEDKLLVVGYTDSRGDNKKNLKLSSQRAYAVRREIVGLLGIDGRQVIALGRGEAEPVGDNKTRAGRARNRRVEIFLAHRMIDFPKGQARHIDPDRMAIMAMVQDAKRMLQRKRLQEALQILHRARAQGGDQVGDWHTMYGIIGFYTGIPTEKVKAHLTIALQMNPFDLDARNYLGRATAREMVGDGRVSAAMGTSSRDPIAVLADAQIHEYLQLFKVQPLSKRDAAIRGVQVWSCRDARGTMVEYYFNRSPCFSWAFDPPPVDRAAIPDGTPVAAPMPIVMEAFVKGHSQQLNGASSADKQIWESKLYR